MVLDHMAITESTETGLADIGIAIGQAKVTRRALARQGLDWSEGLPPLTEWVGSSVNLAR
jgi:hypothetical protein